MKEEDNEDNWQCDCTGPQNGEPVCPCRMRTIKVRNGRYVEEKDLGPVKDTRQFLQE